MITIPGRIPINIYPMFWFLIILLGWINSFSLLGTALWMLVILVSVLVHEYGHALTAMAFGQTAEISLVALGGVTQRKGKQLTLWQEFLVVLNGPVAGALLAMVAYWFMGHIGEHKTGNVWSYVVAITFYANVFWTIVNLLPIHPMDGGRLLSIMMEAAFGMRGVRIALFISSVLALIASLGAFAINAILLGALFMLFAFESYREWRNSLVMTKDDRNEELSTLLHQAEQEMRKGHRQLAEEKLMKIRETTRQGFLYMTATEYLANLLKDDGEYNEAYNLLKPHEKNLTPSALKLLHELAYHLGDWKEVVSLGDRVYMDYSSYDIALINAMSHAKNGSVRPAIGWLQRAIEDGLPNLQAVFKRKEFDAIRDSHSFRELQQQHYT